MRIYLHLRSSLLVALFAIAGVHGAAAFAEPDFFSQCAALERANKIQDLSQALDRASATQRGDYRYSYFRAAVLFASNLPSAGDARASETLAAMKADGRSDQDISAVKERLSRVAGLYPRTECTMTTTLDTTMVKVRTTALKKR